MQGIFMKRNGFTLSELIIVLCVVGVVSALIAPALSGLMPDKNKLKVLKYHNQVINAVSELLDDDAVYYGDCQGLECSGKPKISPYSDINYEENNANAKFSALMKYKLGLDDDNQLPDGSEWTINGANGAYTISVDVDGSSNGKNAKFSSTCSKPDIFEFSVDKYGKVTAHEALTEAYMLNPLETHSKKEDVAAAKKSTLYK
jgi:prepilin-type N-terminal cleavage/methylation domain-containing protein